MILYTFFFFDFFISSWRRRRHQIRCGVRRDREESEGEPGNREADQRLLPLQDHGRRWLRTPVGRRPQGIANSRMCF